MDRWHERFGHIHAAELPEAAMVVRVRCH
jgi:hypothetical protein